jgi:LCP family protein required for cell wall assembly
MAGKMHRIGRERSRCAGQTGKVISGYDPPYSGRRRGVRIALTAALTMLSVLVGTAAGGYAFLGHLAANVQRIPVAWLTAAGRPAGGLPGGGMNVLLTGEDRSAGANTASGLIMILHFNADHRAGGAVSLHPFTTVTIPGHGRLRIEDALALGGPSLLVRTVERVTHLPIDHYARIDLPHVANVIQTIGGVTVPTTSGALHLNGAGALAYARNPAVSEEDRVLRQQALLRAVAEKITHAHLLVRPVIMVRVLDALTSMLTVDSNFTERELTALARQLSGLSSSAATFVIAPYYHAAGRVFFRPRASRALWAAIRLDSLAAFAKRYPRWVTPAVVP